MFGWFGGGLPGSVFVRSRFGCVGLVCSNALNPTCCCRAFNVA